MNRLMIIVFIFLIFPCYSEETDINTLPMYVENLISEENKDRIKNYFINEVFNGTGYIGRNLTRDEVIKHFGMPIEENITRTRLASNVVLIKSKLLYDGLFHSFHRIAIGSNIGEEYYGNIEINKPIERLETINIGDSVNKVREIFGNIRGETNNFIIYRIRINDDKMFDAMFYIENNIVIKIEGWFVGYQ